MTADTISFDEDFMSRHYVFDRKSGLMTLTAVGMDDGLEEGKGERFTESESICHAPK